MNPPGGVPQLNHGGMPYAPMSQPPLPPMNAVPHDLRSRQGVEYQDVRNEKATEAKAFEQLSSWTIIRLEKSDTSLQVDYFGYPQKPSWDQVMSTLNNDITKPEANRQVQHLQEKGGLLEKKNALPPTLQRQIELAGNKLNEYEPNRQQFCHKLVQLEEKLKRIDESSHHRKSKSKKHHRSHSRYKTKKHEILYVILYFQRSPRPGESALRILEDMHRAGAIHQQQEMHRQQMMHQQAMQQQQQHIANQLRQQQQQQWREQQQQQQRAASIKPQAQPAKPNPVQKPAEKFGNTGNAGQQRPPVQNRPVQPNAQNVRPQTPLIIQVEPKANQGKAMHQVPKGGVPPQAPPFKATQKAKEYPGQQPNAHSMPPFISVAQNGKSGGGKQYRASKYYSSRRSIDSVSSDSNFSDLSGNTTAPSSLGSSSGFMDKEEPRGRPLTRNQRTDVPQNYRVPPFHQHSMEEPRFIGQSPLHIPADFPGPAQRFPILHPPSNLGTGPKPSLPPRPGQRRDSPIGDSTMRPNYSPEREDDISWQRRNPSFPTRRDQGQSSVRHVDASQLRGQRPASDEYRIIDGMNRMRIDDAYRQGNVRTHEERYGRDNEETIRMKRPADHMAERFMRTSRPAASYQKLAAEDYMRNGNHPFQPVEERRRW